MPRIWFFGRGHLSASVNSKLCFANHCCESRRANCNQCDKPRSHVTKYELACDPEHHEGSSCPAHRRHSLLTPPAFHIKVCIITMVNTRIQAIWPNICPGCAIHVLDTRFTQLTYVLSPSSVSVPDFEHSITPKLCLIPWETISRMDFRSPNSTCSNSVATWWNNWRTFNRTTATLNIILFEIIFRSSLSPHLFTCPPGFCLRVLRQGLH